MRHGPSAIFLSVFSPLPADPFDLRRRFVKMQKEVFPDALAQMHKGKKSSHWVWYVLPTPPYVPDGVERGTPKNKEYALRDPPPCEHEGFKAARAYLDFPEQDGVSLRRNLFMILKAIWEKLELKARGSTAREAAFALLGQDRAKLVSSAQLFYAVTRNIPSTMSEALRAISLKENSDPELHDLCGRILFKLNAEPCDEFLTRARTVFDVIDLT